MADVLMGLVFGVITAALTMMVHYGFMKRKVHTAIFACILLGLFLLCWQNEPRSSVWYRTIVGEVIGFGTALYLISRPDKRARPDGTGYCD